MLLKTWKRRFGSHSYSRLDEHNNQDETSRNSLISFKSSLKWLLYCLFSLLAVTIALAGLVGYLFYELHLLKQSESSHIEGTVAQGKILTAVQRRARNFLICCSEYRDDHNELSV